MPQIGIGAAGVAAQRALGYRNDPYSSCNFHVEIQGIIAGGFTSVSGLDITTGVESIRQGGVNNKEYKLPLTTSYSDIVLKHGLSDIDLLWNWYEDVIAGKIQRKNITIYLLGANDVPAMWWDVYRAFPIKAEGPSFDASSNSVSIQTLVITHEGLVRPLASQVYSGAKGAAGYAASKIL